jgi:hypothetical protein
MNLGALLTDVNVTSWILPVGQLVAGTITSASHDLPVATLNVADTTDFPSSGTVYVGTTGQAVAYTGKTGTTFTGCTGGTGTLASGSVVTNVNSKGQALPVVGIDVLSSQYAALDALIGAAAPVGFGQYVYSGGSTPGAGKFRLPDGAGRPLVGRGRHADLAAGASDGLANASRKMKHRHGKGTISASGGSHGHTMGRNIYWHGASGHTHANSGHVASEPAGGAIVVTNPSVDSNTHSHPNGEFSGEVGDTGGPLDTTAFQVVGGYIIIA